MIQLVSSALLELQSAVLARALYPTGHPRTRASEEKAHALLTEALAHRAEITVFALEDRVVFGDEVLPSSASLVDSLFRMLRERGADQISFRAGLDAPQLRKFLDKLAEPHDESSPLLASAHLSFGALVAGARAAAPSTASGSGSHPSLAAAGALEGIWQGIHETQDLGGDTLSDIVSSLSRVVEDSSCAILPLAFVKGHDEYTFVHIINVGILTMALGESLGFDAQMTQEIGISALLHDVGKMAVPLEILNKNGRFTDEEFKTMQVHPVEGARMLLRTHGVSDLAAIVAYEHHVRYDGGGYPKVPAGWKLNLASRICMIADVYDALRTDRPYRPGMPIEKITKIMKGDAGTYFDPDLLDVFFDQVLPRVHGVEEGVKSRQST